MLHMIPVTRLLSPAIKLSPAIPEAFTIFRNMIFSAVIAGVLAGLLLSTVQRIQILPIILEAETYEVADAPKMVATEWHGRTPADGTEHIIYTVLANILTGIGFALLLAAAIIAKNRSGWKNGMLWGLGGYAAFFVAPSLSLLPAIPGTVAADLESRQLWWAATVVATIVGLGLLVFSKSLLMRGPGIILLAIPHIVGASLPAEHESPALEALAHAFIQATVIANAVFWVALGALTGLILQKISASEN